MTEAEYQIAKSIGLGFAFASAVGLQHMRPHRVLLGSWRANGGLGALNTIILGAVCAGCACAASDWASRAGFGLLNQGAAPSWLGVVVTIVGIDFVSYAWHRANHQVTLLWRFHQAHHSDPAYTVTTALRFHPGELLLALPLRLFAVAALGAPVSGILAFELLFGLANLWEHGNINLPARLERILSRMIVTPALHRRHHSRENLLLNTNYGTIFSIWDRWLGSFGESTSVSRIDTGLPGIGRSLNTFEILALPARGVFRGTAGSHGDELI